MQKVLGFGRGPSSGVDSRLEEQWLRLQSANHVSKAKGPQSFSMTSEQRATFSRVDGFACLGASSENQRR